MRSEDLVKAAGLAREKAYVPYSGFRVGAALLTTSGEVVTGCNVENASYGLTMCAERVALGKAVSEGKREFAAIAVCGDSDGLCLPCGACRQVLAEFAPDLTVYAADRHGQYRAFSIQELLPHAFRLLSPDRESRTRD